MSQQKALKEMDVFILCFGHYETILFNENSDTFFPKSFINLPNILKRDNNCY